MPEKKILIVDADVASRNFIARILAEQDYEVIQAGSGKEGLISAWRDHPDLLIIEPKLADLKGEDIARKLRADSRTAALPLIALSGEAGMARVKSCMEAGFNEYITKSGQAVTLLQETLARLLEGAESGMKKGGLLMLFLSAKGGTGTSSICANMAMNISHTHPEARVAVVDMVLPIGSIAPIVGYEEEQNIVSVSDRAPGETTPKFFKDHLPFIPLWNFYLLAGSPDPESSGHLKVGRIWDMVKALKGAFDYVLVDIGRSLSRITLPLIQSADAICLVVNTDASASSLTRTLCAYLEQKGVHSSSLFTILNRTVEQEGLSKQDAEKAIGMPMSVSMPYLGGRLTFANAHHQPYALNFPHDTAAIIFRDAARDITALANKIRSG